ncbi:MAG: hypothetical protein WD512_08085, partial [Candidatus Paceibacterota bacterium]
HAMKRSIINNKAKNKACGPCRHAKNRFLLSWHPYQPMLLEVNEEYGLPMVAKISVCISLLISGSQTRHY